MGNESGLHPGAIWRRVDIQCHSPRDLRWSGSGLLPGGAENCESARDAWANSFVQAAIDRGLDVVAITDHHDVAFVPYVQKAATRAGNRLVILPGIEITCHDNVQCLAIFEADTDQSDWDRLISKLNNVKPSAAHEAKTCNVQACSLTIKELFSAVLEDSFLCKKLILVPHFGNEDSHKSLNDPGFASRAKDLDCDAVYIECPYGDLQETTVQKITGAIAEWGTRRRAILATGDNRSASWNRLGAHECWVRLGETTIEGFRQAFLADEARVSHTRPTTPAERIVQVEIQSTLTGPDPLRISFNESFTALIGGRGSGKSSVLEYLRFGLGKSEADLANDAGGKRRREREARLIEETLSAGYVQLTLEREGVRETWRRTGVKSDEIIVIQNDRPAHTLTIDAAQKRFPARAFHQKELSTTMVDGDAAADNITGIAAAEIIEERRRIEQDIAAAKRDLTVWLQHLAAHWQAELQLSEAQMVTEDVRRRRASVTESLQQGGVGEADLEVLADAARFGQAENFLAEVERRLGVDASRLAVLNEEILNIDSSRFSDALSFHPLLDLDQKISSSRAKVTNLLKAADQELKQLKDMRSQAMTAFEVFQTDFNVRYEMAKDRQNFHSDLIKDNERLAVILKTASADEDAALANVSMTRNSVAAFAEAKTRLENLVEQRYNLLRQAADEVKEKSAGALKARVKRDRKPLEYISALCEILEGSRIREPEVFCQDWLSEALKTDAKTGWDSICDGLLSVYQSKIMSGSPSEPSSQVAKEIQDLFFPSRGQSLSIYAVGRIFSNLTDQTLGVLLSAVPRDGIALTYVSDGQDIQFETASPGQQASALLRLLLQQVAGTLIIDQPEDDLDNRVLMEIVGRIRSSKGIRQLIFATHNPNLVVNGDADKVVCMVATVPEDRAPAGSARVRVQVDGAIETPAVRDAITSVMEGGLEAFDLRARKYRVEGVVR